MAPGPSAADRRRKAAEGVAEANGVPLWLAYLEPVWAYAMLCLAGVLVVSCVGLAVWALWLTFA